MKTKLLALLVTTALAGPAFAQEAPAPAAPTGAAPTEQAAPDMAAPAVGDSAGFITQQDADQWRASELIGTNVYGPDDSSIGSISDVLVGRDGQVEVAIVGVGGFLGIGRKDVGIPFTSIEWRFDAPAAAGATNPDGTPAAGAPAAAPADGTGTMAPSGAAATSTEPADASAAASPDRAYVTFTREQLDQAPAFVNIDDTDNPANPAPAAGTDTPPPATTTTP